MMILPYMLKPKQQFHQTEAYVASPPALFIYDERGDVWTLGLDMYPGPRGEYAFDILRNGVKIGERGSRIERRGGAIRIFTPEGVWKRWTGKTFF